MEIVLVFYGQNVMARIFSWPECVSRMFFETIILWTLDVFLIIFVVTMFGQNVFLARMFGHSFMETGHVFLWPECFRGQNAWTKCISVWKLFCIFFSRA